MRQIIKKGRAGQLSKQELKAKLKRIARNISKETTIQLFFVYLVIDYLLPGGLF